MYRKGDRVKVKIETVEGQVIKKSEIVDTELHPNGSIAYRLKNGLFVRTSQILGKIHNDEYSKQKEKLKL